MIHVRGCLVGVDHAGPCPITDAPSISSEPETAEEFWRDRCQDCAHDQHPLRTCHEIIGAIGGDPSNGPDHCPCTIDYANGAMEAEIARLTRLIEGSDPASPEAPDGDFESMLAGYDRIIHDKALQQELLAAGLLVRVDPATGQPTEAESPDA